MNLSNNKQDNFFPSSSTNRKQKGVFTKIFSHDDISDSSFLKPFNFPSADKCEAKPFLMQFLVSAFSSGNPERRSKSFCQNFLMGGDRHVAPLTLSVIHIFFRRERVMSDTCWSQCEILLPTHHHYHPFFLSFSICVSSTLVAIIFHPSKSFFPSLFFLLDWWNFFRQFSQKMDVKQTGFFSPFCFVSVTFCLMCVSKCLFSRIFCCSSRHFLSLSRDALLSSSKWQEREENFSTSSNPEFFSSSSLKIFAFSWSLPKKKIFLIPGNDWRRRTFFGNFYASVYARSFSSLSASI